MGYIFSSGLNYTLGWCKNKLLTFKGLAPDLPRVQCLRNCIKSMETIASHCMFYSGLYSMKLYTFWQYSIQFSKIVEKVKNQTSKNGLCSEIRSECFLLFKVFENFHRRRIFSNRVFRRIGSPNKFLKIINLSF